MNKSRENYIKSVNNTTINCWIIMSIAFIACYILEIFKGARSPLYVIAFSAFILIPLLITMFFNKKWKGKNENIKYFVTFGYMIFYTFSLMTTNTSISFVYIVPMISILIVYCDVFIISVLYIYSIIINIVYICGHIISGFTSPEDIKFYEIQMACLILSYVFLMFTLRLVKKNRDSVFELSNELVTDELTGAFNRKFISNHIIVFFNKYLNYDLNNGLSLAFIDIDKFGDFNNMYGHEFGDIVLKEFSKIVLDYIKPYPNICFIRNGGDEFLLMGHSMEYKDFIKVVNDIKEKVANKKLYFEGKEIGITLSVGCANTTNDKYDDFFDLKDKADERLYVSKDNGRNTVTYQERN